MPQHEISPCPDTAEARRELVDFLTQHWEPRASIDWEKRMRHWWDDNPAAHSSSERGRRVHINGRLAGFGGLIPALHAWQGQPVPALYATTLCVDPQHAKAAALIFLKQREGADDYLIAHTTPNPRVQKALLKIGAHAERYVTRHFFSAGTASWMRGRFWWPPVSAQKRLVTDAAEVSTVRRPYRHADRVEKWITPEYLRWFCSSPTRQHYFLGLVDGEGMLSSCLLLASRRVKGLRSWDVLEAFTTETDDTELHALIGRLVKKPGLLPGGAALVTAATFPDDRVWDRAPALVRREQQVCHFFLPPLKLRDAPKHTVMAEGDLGL